MARTSMSSARDLRPAPGATYLTDIEAVLLGGDITVEARASKLDTISGQVFCKFSARVPRVCLGAGNE